MVRFPTIHPNTVTYAKNNGIRCTKELAISAALLAIFAASSKLFGYNTNLKRNFKLIALHQAINYAIQTGSAYVRTPSAPSFVGLEGTTKDNVSRNRMFLLISIVSWISLQNKIGGGFSKTATSTKILAAFGAFALAQKNEQGNTDFEGDEKTIRSIKAPFAKFEEIKADILKNGSKSNDKVEKNIGSLQAVFEILKFTLLQNKVDLSWKAQENIRAIEQLFEKLENKLITNKSKPNDKAKGNTKSINTLINILFRKLKALKIELPINYQKSQSSSKTTKLVKENIQLIDTLLAKEQQFKALIKHHKLQNTKIGKYSDINPRITGQSFAEKYSSDFTKLKKRLEKIKHKNELSIPELKALDEVMDNMWDMMMTIDVACDEARNQNPYSKFLGDFIDSEDGKSKLFGDNARETLEEQIDDIKNMIKNKVA